MDSYNHILAFLHDLAAPRSLTHMEVSAFWIRKYYELQPSLAPSNWGLLLSGDDCGTKRKSYENTTAAFQVLSGAFSFSPGAGVSRSSSMMASQRLVQWSQARKGTKFPEG